MKQRASADCRVLGLAEVQSAEAAEAVLRMGSMELRVSRGMKAKVS
jgi:hypothetical protein